MKHKRIIVTRFGGPEVLQVAEEELPEPKAHEVRVKILAAGVSFADLVIREGLHPIRPHPPFTLGWEIVGVVDKIGEGVSAVKLGQMVAALPVLGGYAEYLCLPESECVLVPEGLEPCEAVSVVFIHMTAYQMLHRSAKVKAGERVLIHGAAGAVGTALLELGKLAGLTMYGTASIKKHELVSNLGAIPIDYTKSDFVEQIKNLTGDGVDVGFDGIGGPHLWRSYQALRPGGRLIVFGHAANLIYQQRNFFRTLSTWLASLGIFALNLLPGKRVILYSVQTLKKRQPAWFREDLTSLFTLLSQKQIRPEIALRLPLADVPKAHELLAKSAVTGRIVLETRNKGVTSKVDEPLTKVLEPSV